MSKPTLGDVVGAISLNEQINGNSHQNRIIKTYKSDAEEAVRLQQSSNPKFTPPKIEVKPQIPVPENRPPVINIKPVFTTTPIPAQAVPSVPVPIPVPTPTHVSIPTQTPVPAPAPAPEIKKPPTIIYTNEIEEKPKKHILVPVLVVVILLALGGAAIPTVQYFLNQKTVPVPIATETTIIPFDHKETITLPKTSHTDLINAISKLPANAVNVEYVQIFQTNLDANQKTTTSKMPADTFSSIFGPNMPSSLVRSFDGDYMYGVDGIKHPRFFILLKTSAYDQTFAGMLKWEPKMISDLTPVLNILAKAAGQSFTDKVITSKDVRAIVQSDGTISFLYGFIDNQTLLITTDTTTFQDITNRYVAARFVQ